MTAAETVAGRELTAKEWFGRYPELSGRPLFTMRVRLSGGLVTVRAFEGPHCPPTHTRLYCELWIGSVRDDGKPLFPREDFTVGIPAHQTIDGVEARECVLGLFCLRPGDTDAEFFRDYSQHQLDFVNALGEELDLERTRRFCDVNGNVCARGHMRRWRR